jgi:hypothetical protein
MKQFLFVIGRCVVSLFQWRILLILISTVSLSAASDLNTMRFSGRPFPQYVLLPQRGLTIDLTLYGTLNTRGVDLISFFIPLLNKDVHHVRWETGTILLGSSLGYRQVPKQYLLGRPWFWGGYLDYKAYPVVKTASNLFSLYRWNAGVELGISRVGRITVNYYWIPYIYSLAPSSLSFRDLRLTPSVRFIHYPIASTDNKGASVQFTVPLLDSVQASLFCTFDSILHKRGNRFHEETVASFGGSLQYFLNSRVRIVGECIFIGPYQKGRWGIGLVYGSADNNLSRDAFQGYLGRGPERCIPLYLAYEITQGSTSGTFAPGGNVITEEERARIAAMLIPARGPNSGHPSAAPDIDARGNRGRGGAPTRGHPSAAPDIDVRGNRGRGGAPTRGRSSAAPDIDARGNRGRGAPIRPGPNASGASGAVTETGDPIPSELPPPSYESLYPAGGPSGGAARTRCDVQ